MKKFNQTEKLAFNQAHPKKPTTVWQVICGKVVIFGPANRGLCVWWCRRHCIKLENIKVA